ncbi:hypothetical protein [Microbacterium sp.]|uniref:hypothetical protein n=1 Tax=Microbacterium sp. TaxID=51671 RepID=UPI003242AF70
MNDQQRFYELAQQKADSTEGICVDVDWSSRLAVVNVNGVELSVPWEGPAPWPADRIRLVKAGVGNLFCKAVFGAPMGTVLTVTSTVATVHGDDDAEYVYPFLGAAPTSGARVRLDHAGRCIPNGAYSTEPAGSDVIPVPPPPPPSGGSATFTALWSGSWRGGVFDTDGVESSYTRVAAVGFGNQVRDTVPAAARVTRAELQLVQEWNRSFSSTPVRFGMHGFDGRPESLTAAALSGSLSVAQDARTADISAFLTDLRSGAAKGVGIYPDSAYWVRYAPAPNGVRLYLEWSL